MLYISSWEAHVNPVSGMLKEAVDNGEIEANDVVWSGPSGDYVICGSPADLDEDYMEYSDSGLVAEWID
ncbi:MAG: hypothetical protein KDD92_20990 [Caldilineaceae bacterium]|nr:hypothetical protein [Caldilineaceae bacterium]